MLECKINNDVLRFDYALLCGTSPDEQLSKIKDMLITNENFIFIGKGSIINGTMEYANGSYFFKKTIDYDYCIIGNKLEKTWGADADSNKINLMTNYSLFNTQPVRGMSTVRDDLQSLQRLCSNKWSNELLRLEDDFYEDIPQRTPPGRTPKQHKLIMSFNKQGKKSRK